ncbi:unnamed protein product [Caenorhabditis nigoni]
MVLNRMSCVLNPIGYNQMWKRILPIVRILVILLPFGGSWNVWISRIVLKAVYGGFVLSYIRNVEWAPLSIFQSTYILVALAFTVICTTVTLYKMLVLPERLKAAEKSLCFTSIFISITFLLVAATQILWITCCVSDILYALQYLAFDSFTVGSAVIVIAVNKQLRASIYPWKVSERSNSIIVSVVPN